MFPKFYANELQRNFVAMQDQNHPVLINLWAPPGVGKSSNMAAIFNILKYRGLRAEMSPEVAKRDTYESNRMALTDAFYVAARQEYCNHLLRGQVDYIVTDSPPALAVLFALYRDRETVFQMVRHMRARYVNIDVRLLRDPNRKFQTYGRNQTEKQSLALEGALDELLSRLTANVFHRLADNTAAEDIMSFVDERVIGHAA